MKNIKIALVYLEGPMRDVCRQCVKIFDRLFIFSFLKLALLHTSQMRMTGTG